MTPTSKLSSFPNHTFALRVFPSSITFPAETIYLMKFLLTPVAAAVFAITAPALDCGLFPLLLSSWKYFATFSIICSSSTLIDFPLFRLEHPGSGEMMSAIFQSTQKANLLGLRPHFIIDDIGSRTKTPQKKTPGHKPPDKNPLDKNPPYQKPPGQKPPRQNILFRNFITFVFRMSYGKEISIWFLAVKYTRHGSIK